MLNKSQMLLLPKTRNRRLSPKARQKKATERGKPDVRRHPRRVSEEQTMNFKHWLAVLVLTPVALVTALTLVEMGWRLLTRHAIWRTEGFQFFVLGSLGWGAAYWLGRFRPVRTYVFGHELSHAMAAWMLGAKVYKFEVTAEGGYVETNKTNTLISLAPYLLPIYSLAILAGFGVTSWFIDLDSVHKLSLLGLEFPFKMTRLLFILLGLSWAFHATYTFITLRSEQSDLTRNGEFFSLMLIFLVNATWLIAMFVATSPHPELGLTQTWQCWWGVAQKLIGLTGGFVY